MNTDYNLYKIFIYLYEEKSISKTANRLYVSQPAISYSLKELESQLGYTLFYRNSKGIEPTLEAKELYGYVSTAFSILNDAEEHLKNLNDLNIGEIRIGVPSYIAMFYLSKYIVEFRKLFPGVKFELISKTTDSMVQMLEQRQLDLIIAPLPINSKKEVTKIALAKFKNCFTYNKELFKNISIKSPEDLKDYPLMLPSKISSVRIKLDEYLESENAKVSPILESWPIDSMMELVRKGVGIGYIIKDVVDAQNDKDKFETITFDNKLPDIDVCCVYIDSFLTAASKKFIEILTKNK